MIRHKSGGRHLSPPCPLLPTEPDVECVSMLFLSEVVGVQPAKPALRLFFPYSTYHLLPTSLQHDLPRQGTRFLQCALLLEPVGRGGLR